MHPICVFWEEHAVAHSSIVIISFGNGHLFLKRQIEEYLHQKVMRYVNT